MRLAIGISSVAVLASVGVVGWQSLGHMERRLERLERENRAQAQDEETVEEALGRLQDELASIEATLDQGRRQVAGSLELKDRVGDAESELSAIKSSLEESLAKLDALEFEYSELDQDAWQEGILDLGERLEERFEGVYTLASNTAHLLDENQTRLENLDALFMRERDSGSKWRDLMGPVVMLSGEESVGSGVLIRDAQEGSGALVLTAWHVVRDIQGGIGYPEREVPVIIYREAEGARHEIAHLLERDPDLDVALLELDSPDGVDYVASLPLRARLEALRTFDRIYAVGCPLGNDPIPTLGQVAELDHRVDGNSYLMINAPTYVGNSGGGIFVADTRELLGVFSKVYTHGSVRPTIITHMGLVTPLDRIYEWFHLVGWGELEPTEDTLAVRGE